MKNILVTLFPMLLCSVAFAGEYGPSKDYYLSRYFGSISETHAAGREKERLMNIYGSTDRCGYSKSCYDEGFERAYRETGFRALEEKTMGALRSIEEAYKEGRIHLTCDDAYRIRDSGYATSRVNWQEESEKICSQKAVKKKVAKAKR